MASTKKPTLGFVRADIASLQAERDAILSAPLAHETIRAAVLATLTRAAADYGATLSRMLRFPDRGEGIRLHAPLKNSPATMADLTGLLAAVFGPDALAAALDRHVVALSDGPTEADRAQQLAAIAEDLAAAEEIEEALVQEAEAAGVPVARRGDARPEIVLRVRDV